MRFRNEGTLRRPAFTLVELLLTLTLSVVLMSLIGSALSFYATKLETRNTEVRRVQLAQAILNMINDDLRVAIYPPEFDDAALSDLLTSATGGSTEQPGEGEDLSAAGLDDMSGEEEDVAMADTGSAEMSDISSGSVTTARPGLIGNQTQIQFDLSRLPRLEEYQQQLVGDSIGEVLDVPSDIKTVTYFIQPAGGGIQDPLDIVSNNSALATASPTGTSMGGGLIRRSLDRAVTTFSLAQGGLTTLSSTGDLLATEVVGLEFRYWDGLIWQTYWDSDEFGSLPVAIEVTLTMLEPSGDDASEEGAMLTTQYQQIIRLPMGRTVASSDVSGLSAAGL